MAYAPADPTLFSKRGLILAVIVVFHVLFFWALNNGMATGFMAKVMGPIETRIIDEVAPEDEAPPPPPPKIETPPPFVPPPDIAIDIPVETAPATAITQTTNQRPVAQPPPAPAAPVQKATTQPKSDPRRPLTQPEYPPSSRRAGEAGTVILEVYVLETGRVGEARVAKSSGFPRLDEAAVREVKRSWRLTPGTENGKPVPMWGQFAVTFKLTD